MEGKSKRIFGKLNIIDVLVLVLVLALAVFVGTKMMGSSDAGEAPARVGITYTALAECRDPLSYEYAAKYVPATIMADGALHSGEVVAVESQPYMIYADGQWVEDPYHVNIIFTVEGTVAKEAVMSSLMGKQEIRVGKPHILKTEYVEFQECVITSVEWTEE